MASGTVELKLGGRPGSATVSVRACITPRLGSASGAARKNSKDIQPAVSSEVIEAIERVIREGEKTNDKIKELVEEESAPGAMGRSAAVAKGRARRKSKDLQVEFDALIGNHLETVFKQFDTDGSGTLDHSELKEAFAAAGRPATDEQIDKAVKTMDTDGDGVISLEEFKNIVRLVSMPT